MKHEKGLMHKTAQNQNLYIFLYLLYLILANQIQATWSAMSVNCSSRKKILAEVIENLNLSQLIKLISRFFFVKLYPNKKVQ